MAKDYRIYRVGFDLHAEPGFAVLSWGCDGVETMVEFFFLDAEGNMLEARRQRGRNDHFHETSIGDLVVDSAFWVARTEEAMRAAAQRLRDETLEARYPGAAAPFPVELVEARPLDLMRVRFGAAPGEGLEVIHHESSSSDLQNLAKALGGIRQVPIQEDLSGGRSSEEV